MAFRKEGEFGGGQGGKRSFGGKRFGGKKPFGNGGGFGGPKEMFSATCAQCGKPCEVPFRPSGDRPVYCRECFGGKSDAPRNDFGGRRDNTRSFEPRRGAPSFAPQQNQNAPSERFNELKRQIDAVHNKLDVMTKLIEALTPSTHTKPATLPIEESAPKKPAKKAKAKPAKK